MKELKPFFISLTILASLFYVHSAYAQTQFNVFRSLIPETDSKYYLGTTTPSLRAWLRVISDSFYDTDASDGCAEWSSNVLTSTGVSCGSGSGGSDPFTHPAASQSATTSLMIFSGGFMSSASSTISSNLNITGNATATSATTTNFFATTASSTDFTAQTATLRKLFVGSLGGVAEFLTTSLNGDQSFTLPDASGTFALGSGAANRCAQWDTTNVLGESGTPCLTWPFTQNSYAGTLVHSTTTGLWLTGSPLSLVASSTFATSATTTNATTTNLGVSGNITFNGVTGSTWASFCTTITGGSGLCDGDDATGGSASWPFTPSTNFSTSTQATSTPLDLKVGLYASSTSLFEKVGIGTSTPNSALSVSTTTQGLKTTPLLTVSSTTHQTLFQVLGDGATSILGALTLSNNLVFDSETFDSLTDDATLANNSGDLQVVDVTCTDCLNATEIEDIYLLNSTDSSTGAYTWTGLHTFTNASSTQFTVGNAGSNVGIYFTEDGDGALTTQGIGNANNESITQNFDDNADILLTTSATGITGFDYSAIRGRWDGLVIDGDGTYPASSDGSLLIGDGSDAGTLELEDGPACIGDGGCTPNTMDGSLITATQLGIATTTFDSYQATISSSTAPQLSLSNGAGFSQWVMRNDGLNFIIATTTVAGSATSSINALKIDTNGQPYLPFLVSCSSGIQSDANGKLSCGTSGTTAWDSIGDPTGNGAIAMGETIQTLDWNTGAVSALGEDYLTLTATNDAAADVATQRLLVLQNTASANGLENLLVLDNADADDVVTTGIEITSGAGGITTAIDVDDAEITNALVAGANDLSGTGWSLLGGPVKFGIGTTSPFSTLSVSTTTASALNLPLFTVASSTHTSLFQILSGGQISLGTTTSGFLKTSSSGVLYSATSTRSITIFTGASLTPDTGGNSWLEPYSITASNDNFLYLVGVASSTAAKTGFYGQAYIPADFNGGCSVTVLWTSPLTTGDVVYDFAYRGIGGDDAESLDQTTFVETVTATDSAPSAVNERNKVTMPLTCTNLAADDTLQFYISRDGADAADTLASDAVIHDVIFNYSN